MEDREFIKIGQVRVEPSKILLYQPYQEYNGMFSPYSYGIRFFYNGEYPDIHGWINGFYDSEHDRDMGILMLDKLKLKDINTD